MCAKLRTVAASNNRARNLSYYCLFAPRIYIFVLRTHPVRGEAHNQRNATGEVATVEQFVLKFRNLPLQANERTRANRKQLITA